VFWKKEENGFEKERNIDINSNSNSNDIKAKS